MSRSRDGGERRPLWRRLRALCDQATRQDCRVEIVGNAELTVMGCERILDYTPACIRLAVRDGHIGEMVIAGRELVCLSYHPDALVIRGRIAGVSFCPLWERNEKTEGGADR